uniref:Peptidase M12B domain-containing protein n=1 Tax=Macrostomum lignano TaxID=282301 RepID=A0A1I8GMB0_9PLAT
MEIEVQLPKTNKKARIPLIRTNILDNAPITVIENGIARTFSGEQAHHGDHAHYRDIKTKSTISVRIQNNDTRINGHVMHEGTAYFITNSSVAKTAGSIKSHKINIDQVLSRKKRQTNEAATEYEVELLILCDHTVWNLFKTVYGNDDKALTELHFYYTHILNGMDTAFRNIGQPSISVKCVGLTVAKTLADVKWMSKSGPYYDTNAEVDFYYMMAYAKDKPADHVMAFTRSNIRFNEAGSEIAGVALFAGACSDQRLSIVKDEGLHSWGVAAHELAHSLGADHDDNKPQCEKWRKFIQTPVLSDYSIGDVANSYRFSKCSVEEMKSFLSTKNATCLKSRQSTAKAVLTSNASEGAREFNDSSCNLRKNSLLADRARLEAGDEERTKSPGRHAVWKQAKLQLERPMHG